MKSLIPQPQRTLYWVCSDCGTKTSTSIKAKLRFAGWWTALIGNPRPPVCPECGKKMVQMKIYY